MNATVSGKIIAIANRKEGVSKAGKAYVTCDYLLQEEGEKGTLIQFNVFGEENINQYNLTVGKLVTVNLEVEAREWNGKYFTSVRCLKCYEESKATKTPNTNEGTTTTPHAHAHAVANSNPVPAPNKASDNVDDLPF